MTKGYIFGDTEGCYEELFSALKGIGVNVDTGEIPEDTIIIHTGNILGKDRGSLNIIEFLQKVIPTGRWIQIVGSHEAMHINQAYRHLKCSCGLKVEETLQEFYKEGLIKKAVGIKGEYFGSTDDAIITHAGLTKALWEELGEVEDVTKLSDAINNSDKVNKVGMKIGIPNPLAGVFLADPINEVYASWDDQSTRAKHSKIPFNQIHGNTVTYNYERKSWGMNVDKVSARSISVFHGSRVCLYRMPDGHIFINVDPAFKYGASIPSQSFIEVQNIILK